MTENNKALRFIPFRRRDIVEMCLRANQLGGRAEKFRILCEMIDQIFHFEFHRVAESLKSAYADIDPDSDTRRLDLDGEKNGPTFVELLDALLEKANYQRVSEADLNQALAQSSLFKIKLHVDFDDFAEVSLFTRGESMQRAEIATWFGLGRRMVEFTNFERVVVYLKMRDDYAPGKHDFAGCRAGATLLKMFRNVPKADLEMLFPNTRVLMRLSDKLMIGVPAVVSGGIVVTTKLGASLVLLGSLLGYWLGISRQPVELNQAGIVVLFAGLAALGGYIWKQLSNFKNRKLRFMQALTQSLYFKNLDNNAGVFYRLVNDAEEEESKEAVLAYYFLLQATDGLDKKSLDRSIEKWFQTKWDCVLDFEIDDALDKLVTLGLVESRDDVLHAVELDEAIRRLDRRWDDYFIAEDAPA